MAHGRAGLAMRLTLANILMERRNFINVSMGISMAATMSPFDKLFTSVQKKIETQSDERNFDVIVLGVGSMGSATCYHLAQRGHKVLGLEQFDIPHELGSHAGQSRIIRKAYFELSDYVPLLERAYQNWKALEEQTGTQIYFRTGLVYFGKPSDPLMKGVHESADKYKIKVNSLTSAETSKKYPQFNIPSDYEKLEEPDAGFVTPERSILLFTEQALMKGASIHTKEKVIKWKRSEGTIAVKTDKASYTCKKLVITAGPWAGKMIPGFATNLKVTRQMLAWVKPKKWDNFVLGQFPCWIISEHGKPGSVYGFPILPVGKFGGPGGLKLAHHYQGAVSDPDTISRIPTPEDEAILVDALNTFIPEGYSATLVMKTCMYTNTPDENFVLDFLPGFDEDVAIATGFSGHGFKFASVVGEIMADLSMNGKTTLPIGFLNAGRFK